jgi:hypothetical protein
MGATGREKAGKIQKRCHDNLQIRVMLTSQFNTSISLPPFFSPIYANTDRQANVAGARKASEDGPINILGSVCCSDDDDLCGAVCGEAIPQRHELC